MLNVPSKISASFVNANTVSRTSSCIFSQWRNRKMSSNSGKLVSIVQMTASNDKEENYNFCETMIKKSKSYGVQMVFLPECFDYIGDSTSETVDMAESIDGDLISRYKRLAKQHQMYLSLGGFHQKMKNQTDDNRIKNTHVLINDSGDVAASYVKTHLFDVTLPDTKLQETSFSSPGDRISAPVNTPVGRVGLSICYDLRFPEVSTSLLHNKADILTYPSAFTEKTGAAHWEVLLRSRAIENQCYVVAAAQTGRHNSKRTSYGHSMVVDPWGVVIAQGGTSPGLCLAEIDLDLLRSVRTNMPVQSHRRLDLYGEVGVAPGRCLGPDAIGEFDFYGFGQVKVSASQVFYRSPLSYACVNKKPVLSGHVLVVPLRPAARLHDLTSSEVADLFCSAQNIARQLESYYGGTSLTLAVQDGPEAGQTIQQVHVHLLPRKAGDFEDNDQVYTELMRHDKQSQPDIKSSTPMPEWKNTNDQWRSEEDMAKEAVELRKLFMNLKFQFK